MNPYENLVKANDDYHEAVGEILTDDTVAVEVRTEFSAIVNTVFSMMVQANKTIAKYYEESL